MSEFVSYLVEQRQSVLSRSDGVALALVSYDIAWIKSGADAVQTLAALDVNPL